MLVSIHWIETIIRNFKITSRTEVWLLGPYKTRKL